MTTTFAFVFSGPTVKDLLDDYGVNVTGWTGGGMPPQQNITLPYALGDGSYYQRTIFRERVIQLACTVNQKTLAGYHTKRKAIIAAISRDALNSGTFILRYYGAGATSVDIPVRYNGGLEMDIAADDPLKPFTISLLAVSPFWQSTTLNTVNMTECGAISDGTWLIKQSSGVWAGANAAPNNVAEAPTCIVVTSAGIAYIGTAAALYVRAADGTFTKYATTGGGILCLAMGMDGTTIYIGGSFTNLGGAGIGKCVKLVSTTFSNPSSGTIALNITGIAATASYLWVTTDSSFSTRSLYRCAYGGGWATSLTGVVSNSGTAICPAVMTSEPEYGYTEAVVYAAKSDADARIHVYYSAPDNAYTTYKDMGVTSVGGSVSSIAWKGSESEWVVGGSFTTLGGVSASNIAKVIGVLYSYVSALGAGLNNSVASVSVESYDVYAAGAFTNTGYAYAALNSHGVGWHSAGVAPSQACSVVAAYYYSGNINYLGFAAPGTGPAAGGVAGTTSINNASDRAGYPVITITASAATRLLSIVNTYTGDSLLFNYAMTASEVITIDCTPGVWTITSSLAGNILGALLAGSALSSFGISPGTHGYTMQFSDGTLATAVLTYYYQYMSADSVA